MLALHLAAHPALRAIRARGFFSLNSTSPTLGRSPMGEALRVAPSLIKEGVGGGNLTVDFNSASIQGRWPRKKLRKN